MQTSYIFWKVYEKIDEKKNEDDNKVKLIKLLWCKNKECAAGFLGKK